MGNYYQLFYHATWATKERQPMINEELRPKLNNYLQGKTVDMGGIAFAVGGIENHVHLCLTIPPNIAVSTFIGQLKGASAHWINHIVKPDGSFSWQEGYGIFTISKDVLERVMAYIEKQEEHHRNSTIEKEWEIG